MSIYRRMAAEFVGTFWLVFGGCGAAVLAARVPEVGIGLAGIALAFGLTLLTMAYAIGHISGCHINPAVTIGLWVGRRFAGRDVVPYIIAQVVGGILGAVFVLAIAGARPGFDGNLAANGYGPHSPGNYTMMAGLVSEVVLTFFFLTVILGATDKLAPAGFAPAAMGLALTLVHLIGIPVTNVSVNPARSTGPAVLMGGWALAQLWFFWVFPIIGAILAGWVYAAIRGPED